MLIYGINTVLEALGSGRVKAVRVSDRAGDRARTVLQLASERGVPVRRVPWAVLDRETRGGVHQGIVADLSAPPHYGVADLVRGASGAPLLVVLDGIEDPHNVGAILRTAEAAGADGVIRQTRRAAPLTGAAAKASAGAVALVKIADVVNIARTLEELKEAGVWAIGLAGEAETPYDAVDLTLPTALVLGAEGTGLRRLVRERCDHLVSIPLAGRIDSLNVSVAAGVALFEAVRQRRATVRKNGRIE